jgi:predicted transposase YdaD
MTYITSIERLGIEQGRAEGIEQGRAEGRAEGHLALVLRQLTRRCGALAPATETRIRQLTLGQLAQLAEALLDFTGTDDLDTWLQALPSAEA